VTAGATKVRSGIDNPADDWKSVAQKLVYCRWRDGFDHPCFANTPAWVRTSLPDSISPVPEEANVKNATLWTKDKGSRRLNREYLKS
jgi:hypothetical protein